MNELVTCEWVRSNSGGHVWMGWSCMNEEDMGELGQVRYILF